MRLQTDIYRDGPHLRVMLPDALPPDWAALRRELEFELEEGVDRITIVVGELGEPAADDPSFTSIVADLRRVGIDVFTLRQSAFPGSLCDR